VKKVYGAVAGEWMSLIVYGDEDQVTAQMRLYQNYCKRKAYKTLEAAVAFCRNNQTPVEPGDKHIELQGFPCGSTDYREYLSSQRKAASAPDPLRELNALPQDLFLQRVKDSPA